MQLLLLLGCQSRPVHNLDVVLGKLLRNRAGKELCMTALELAGSICYLLQHLLRAKP